MFSIKTTYVRNGHTTVYLWTGLAAAMALALQASLLAVLHQVTLHEMRLVAGMADDTSARDRSTLFTIETYLDGQLWFASSNNFGMITAAEQDGLQALLVQSVSPFEAMAQKS